MTRKSAAYMPGIGSNIATISPVMLQFQEMLADAIFIFLVALGLCHGCMQVRPANPAIMRAPGAVRGVLRNPGLTQPPVAATAVRTAPVGASIAASFTSTGSTITELQSSADSTTDAVSTTEATESDESVEPIASRLKLVEPVVQQPSKKGCEQPPETSSLFVSDTVDQYNDVSFGPLGGPDSAPYERC
ncbi:unnamed protein product [Gongylonema pulchrum]|uniref:Transmembrane protein n=1 Tax=Gongylonema pulchrum TaxID=637853 RepID=A0A183DZW8_9BILA|nr:unnamed protein product [Gongylonema pulchrum]